MLERVGGRRATGALVALGLVAAAITAVSLGSGTSRVDVSLSDGAVWLPSTTVGVVQLVDDSGFLGAAVGVGALVDDEWSVIQAGSDAVVLHDSFHAVRRVSLATERMVPEQGWRRMSGLEDSNAPRIEGTAAGSDVWLFSPTDALAQSFNLETLDANGAPIEFSSAPVAGVAIRDEFWSLSADGLVQVIQERADSPADGESFAAVDNGENGAISAIGDRAIVLDPTNATLAVLSSSGVERRCDLALEGSELELTAASSGTIVAVLSYDNNALSIADDLDTDGCGLVQVSLGTSTDELGTPVVSGSRVFVPNLSSGEILVVDSSGTATSVSVDGAPQTGFDLIAEGDSVFINDPGSTFAGVLTEELLVIPVEKRTQADVDEPPRTTLPETTTTSSTTTTSTTSTTSSTTSSTSTTAAPTSTSTTVATTSSPTTEVPTTPPIIVDLSVPDVIGLSRTQAEAAVRAAGLVPSVSLGCSVAGNSGEVVDQSPPAPAFAADGSTVDLTVNDGSAAITPSVVGLDQAAAELLLASWDIFLLGETTSVSTDDGLVTSQVPAAGGLQCAPFEITLTIASFVNSCAIDVPNVVGMSNQLFASQGVWEATFEGCDLATTGYRDATGCEVGGAIVVAQDPPAGSITITTAVQATFTTRWKCYVMPNVVGMTRDQASSLILSLSGSIGGASSCGAEEVIISQTPDPGVTTGTAAYSC